MLDTASEQHQTLMEPRRAGESATTPKQPTHAAAYAEQEDPELDALVREIIGRVADKWTMLALETLTEHGPLRFTRLGELIGGVSQKMLTKTVRQMEADG